MLFLLTGEKNFFNKISCQTESRNVSFQIAFESGIRLYGASVSGLSNPMLPEESISRLTPTAYHFQ